MKNILILTDFSECSLFASEYAIQLAKMFKANIHFMHFFSTPLDWVKLPKHKEKLYPETRKAIARAKSELSKWVKKAEANGIMAQQSLTFNTNLDDIFRQFETDEHDLLVIGSYGTKKKHEKLLGSNAQQLIRNASTPVLIIKKNVLKPVKNILFVSDFTDVSRESFHTLVKFADLLEAHIDLLFVNTPKQFTESIETSKNMDMVMTHCNRTDSCTRNVINASSVEEGIKDFLQENPMELIAICTHGKSRLQQIFSPSIAETIVNYIELPFLSIKL